MRLRTLTTLLLLSAPLLWSQTSAGPTIYPPELTAKGKTADMASTKVFPLAGDDLLPQIANGELGGGQIFFTAFRIQNITGQAADVDISYLDGDGNPMPLQTLVNPETGATEDHIGIRDTIPANALRFATTWPSAAPIRPGYARVVSDPPGAIVVTALFNNLIPGVPLFQAGIPQTNRDHDHFFVPYGNRFDQRSSLAIVSLTAQTITVNARDTAGNIACMFTRAMGAGSHFPFLVQLELPCTEDSEGTIEVIGQAASMGAVAFTAQPAGETPGAGAFTTLQVFGPTP